jgi:hypothetical protein
MKLDQIDAQYLAEIDAATDRFGDHESMSRGRVLAWLGQFEDVDLQVATAVLSQVHYYNAANIRAMSRQLVAMVGEEYAQVPRQEIVFVPVGEPGSSAGIIARAIREVSGGERPRVVHMADIERLDPASVSVVVLIDDFSGTGQQLFEWWETVEPVIRPKEAEVVVALLVMNERARQEIERFADKTVAVVELDGQANVLSEESGIFSGEGKATILKYCHRTGARAEYVRGRGDCGLLVAFRHGCPNNSLPILWHQSKKWQALFRRSAL